MRALATVFLALLTTVLCASAAHAGLDGSVYLGPIVDGAFSSHAEAVYVDALRRIDPTARLTGTHSVHGPVVFETPVQGMGQYRNLLEGPADAGHCYGTTLHVKGDPEGLGEDEQTFTGDTKCAPTAPNPKPGTEIEVISPGSPIVLSLRGGYRLSGPDDPVLFDIDADGRLDRMTWTARGNDEAFLALDRDGDGRITNGRELFGDATILRSGAEAQNGFDALREFDDNGDGRIDRQDAAWTRLLLWRDANHDGFSANSEITGLTTTDVAAIGLDYHWTGRRDRYGNEFRYKAGLETAPGSRIHTQVYDIYFVVFR